MSIPPPESMTDYLILAGLLIMSIVVGCAVMRIKLAKFKHQWRFK